MTKLNASLYTSDGTKKGTVELNPVVFGIAFNDALIHQVVTGLTAQRRNVIAHTKGRGDVRGGGKKPWKQKGTGRARHGSRRSPIWVGGGITFGPTKERNFYKKVNKQMRQAALRMVLSDKAREDRIIVLEQWDITDAKTKVLAQILTSLPSAKRSSLLVTLPKDVKVIKAAKNIPKAMSIGAGSLNVLDALKYEYMIVSKDALQVINERYA